MELALTGADDGSAQPLRNLSSRFRNDFGRVSDGDAYYANFCCVIDELAAEGHIRDNKKHMYVLRKIIHLDSDVNIHVRPVVVIE